METEFYTTNSKKEHSYPILLANGKNIRFTENEKGKTPKFSVKLYEENTLIQSLGSVFKEEIDMTVKSLKQLAIAYPDDINFIARAKTIVNGEMIIICPTEDVFERLLEVAHEEFN